MLQSIASRRILIVDDNPTIHADFEKIFQGCESNNELADAEAAFFGTETASPDESVTPTEIDSQMEYRLTHAYSGANAVTLVSNAIAAGSPFEIAFVDMRMPGEWDGLKTIEELWQVDSRLHVVLCTAYSDLSSHDIASRFGQTDKLLFLKKPFDKVEASQVVAALAEKRRLTDLAMSRREELESLVEERTANLNVALKKSEAATRAKAEFISVMSHELKTPLNAIMGFSGILSRSAKSAGFSEVHADAAETIHRNGEHLLKLITQVLDYVELDAETDVVSLSDCRPGDILENAAGEFRRPCAEKGVELTTSVDGVAETVRVDHRLVGKIFHYLIDNALKFTDAGGAIRLEADVDELGAVCFHVCDTGIGIEPERLTNLFVAFEQSDGVHTRSHSGTGLGLGLCHRLATILNSRISVDSEVGRGSTFTIRLPIDCEEPEDSPALTGGLPEQSADADHSVKVSVGVISGSSEFANEVADLIDGCGFRAVVDHLESIHEPKERHATQVLLVDIASADDLALLETLQLDGPTIAVIPDMSPEWEARVIEAGCVDHLARSAIRGTLPSLLRFWAPRD